MCLHYFLLVSMVYSLVSSNVLGAELDESSPISHHLVTRENIHTTSKKMIRGVTVDDSEHEEDNVKEDRGPSSPLTAWAKSISETWAKHDLGVDVLKVLLNMDNMADDALKSATNYKLYDELVADKLPSWSNLDLTPDNVLAKLGIAKLTGDALRKSPNYKYYAEYIRNRVPVWSKNDVDPREVLRMLRMEGLPQKELMTSPNFGFYDKFVRRQIPSWVEKDYSPPEIQRMLGMDKLSFDDFVSVPSYTFYFNFMQQKTESWAVKMIPKSEVKAKLGLVGLSTEAARMDPNHQFYGMYVEKFQIKKLMGRNIPTADVWSYMGLEKASKDLKTMKASFAYMFFTRYVQRVDDEGVLLHQAGKSLPSTMNKPVTSAEMSAKAEIWASTKRTKAYVKWALGLGNLKGEELKTNVAYKYYLQYLKARKVKFEN